MCYPWENLVSLWDPTIDHAMTAVCKQSQYKPWSVQYCTEATCKEVQGVANAGTNGASWHSGSREGVYMAVRLHVLASRLERRTVILRPTILGGNRGENVQSSAVNCKREFLSSQCDTDKQ
jgi:hypothetical protein